MLFLPVRFLPSWFPGNGYKRQAAHFRDRMWDFDNVPHRWVKEQIVSGRLPSYLMGSSDIVL